MARDRSPSPLHSVGNEPRLLAGLGGCGEGVSDGLLAGGMGAEELAANAAVEL